MECFNSMSVNYILKVRLSWENRCMFMSALWYNLQILKHYTCVCKHWFRNMYVCKSQKKTFILDYMYIEWNLTLKKEILKSLNQDIESEFLGTFKLFLIQKKKEKKRRLRPVLKIITPKYLDSKIIHFCSIITWFKCN